MVLFELVAEASDVTAFDWSTLPPLPLLPTRTGEFSFLAPDWSAAESANAPWRLPLDWSTYWIGSLEQPQPPLPDWL